MKTPHVIEHVSVKTPHVIEHVSEVGGAKVWVFGDDNRRICAYDFLEADGDKHVLAGSRQVRQERRRAAFRVFEGLPATDDNLRAAVSAILLANED